MAIHHINCRATASGLDNVAAIVDAMAWLSGDKDQIMVDQTTSYHGSIINIVTVKIEKNRQIKQFTEKLRLGDLDRIIQGISERIDDSNTLHLRLCLDSLPLLALQARSKSINLYQSLWRSDGKAVLLEYTMVDYR